jgi:hypothetical protein
MIYYGQDEKQIVFLLGEPVVNAIASWNHENGDRLVFDLSKNPRFQLAFQQKIDRTTEIEIRQLYPRTRQSAIFKWRFPAQEICRSLTEYEYPYGNRIFHEHPVLILPDYKLSTSILKINLVKYFDLINGWKAWTSARAFSGHYIYGLGPLELELAYNTWYKGVEDGWVQDVETGAILPLGCSPLLSPDDTLWRAKLIYGSCL